MKRKKNYDAPRILQDLKLAFSQSTGVSYSEFETLFNKSTERLPEKFSNSIYARISDMRKTIPMDDEIMSYMIQLHMFYYWSKSKEIYNFDQDFINELLDTPYETIPYQTLKYLPYDTFSITLESSYLIIHKCYDVNHIEGDYLMIAEVSADKQYINVLGIPLSEQFPTVQSLRDVCGNPQQVDVIAKYLNLIMYLTSEKSDIEPNAEQKIIKRKSPKTNTTNSYKEIRKWDVGYRFGSAFRREKAKSDTVYVYDKTSTGSKKRPHIRKAHWHRFWTGARDSDDRQLILKWMPPISINIDDEPKPAIIHEVKQERT